MTIFSEEELEQIKKVLVRNIKKNGKITENNFIIEQIDESTDFERYKYKNIDSIIGYYIKYDGFIDNSNLGNVMLDMEELENKNTGVFTKTNVIVSIITAVILLFTAIATDSVYSLILMVYGLLWAYLSRYIGIKKGIYTGYVWGYFLGLIGFIVVCVLKGEETEIQKENNSNKYEDLERLQKLKESGTITEVEFEIEKAKLLK